MFHKTSRAVFYASGSPLPQPPKMAGPQESIQVSDTHATQIVHDSNVASPSSRPGRQQAANRSKSSSGLLSLPFLRFLFVAALNVGPVARLCLSDGCQVLLAEKEEVVFAFAPFSRSSHFRLVSMMSPIERVCRPR